jgi:hypothetical protein
MLKYLPQPTQQTTQIGNWKNPLKGTLRARPKKVLYKTVSKEIWQICIYALANFLVIIAIKFYICNNGKMVTE